MLNPLAMMSILAVVFSTVMKIGIKDYAVFLFAGLLVWNYFNSTVMMSVNNIRNNARLIGQIPVPKYLFLISVTISNLVNLLLAIIPLLILTLAFGRTIPLTILMLPVMLLPIYLFTVAISILLATSNVFFNDTMHLSEVALQGLYFLSPVLYPRDILPHWAVKYVTLNPLFCQIESMRGILFYGTLPNPLTFSLNLLASFLILLFALAVFDRAEKKFLYFI